MFGLTQKEVKQIKDVLNTNNISKSIIFGSRAKNTYKNGSEIDLAIIGNEKKISYYLYEETNLPYFFDIVNLEKIKNPNLKEHIRRVGISI